MRKLGSDAPVQPTMPHEELLNAVKAAAEALNKNAPAITMRDTWSLYYRGHHYENKPCPTKMTTKCGFRLTSMRQWPNK